MFDKNIPWQTDITAVMCLEVYASGQRCHSHFPLISCKHLFITVVLSIKVAFI